MQRLKKELIIYLVILLVLAIVQHQAELPSLVPHLPGAVVYGMGPLHPLGFALLGYLFIGFLRLFASTIKRLTSKRDL